MPRIGLGIDIARRGAGISWQAYWATLISATIENTAPTHVVLTFHTAQPSLVATDLTCTVNGVNRNISSASWTGAVWTAVLNSAIESGDKVVITFVKTGETVMVKTFLTFIVQSKGNGTGVTTIQLQVTNDITLTVDGDAKFYDNIEGTVNPTSTRVVLAGDVWRVFYLKVPTNTTNLTFSNEGSVKYWGSTNWIEYGFWNDGWEGLTANHPCLTGDLAGFTNLKSFYIAGNNNFSFNLNTISHLTELEEFSVDDDWATFHNTVFGDVADLPRSLKLMLLIGNTTVGGNASDLPRNMLGVILYGTNTLSGILDNLPKTLYFFYIHGLNNLSGNLSDFGPNVSDVLIQGNNTINGYTSGHIWPNQIFAFVFIPVGAGGLDATEVDALFNDLAASTFGAGFVMTITGTNAAPTAASLAARNSISAQGVVLTTN